MTADMRQATDAWPGAARLSVPWADMIAADEAGFSPNNLTLENMNAAFDTSIPD
jgi:hypothetical protein